MFLIAIAFLAGHCAIHALPKLPPLWPWAILPVTALAIVWCVRGSRRPRLRRYLAADCIAALLLGVLWAWSHAAWRLAEQLPADRLTQGTSTLDTEVRGYISSLVDVDDSGVGFTLEVRDADSPTPSRIELTWYDTAERPAPGELWRLRVRLKAPRGFANPGGADYTAALFRGGIGATGYVRDTKRDIGRNVRLQSAGWRSLILRTRGMLAQKLAAALPQSPMLGVVQGLAVGDTQRISSVQWRVFANTGTTHLMAISGLHIGMVAALMAWLAGRIARRLPLQRQRIAVNDVQSIVGMLAALAYSALAGLSVPTQRTLVMLLVYFSTQLLRRQIGVTRGLSIALIGVLLVDPFAPLSPGFWLSFGAVAAIFLATSGRLMRSHWAGEYLHLQGVVTVGLLPFLIGSFGSVSLISPLVNLVAIPFFTFLIVPVVLAGTLLLTVNESLGGYVVRAGAQLLEWSWPVFDWASGLPMAMWHLPQLPLLTAGLMLVGCLIIVAPGVIATRIAGGMLCLPALLWAPPRPNAGGFELAVLDVGQGLAVVVTTHSHVLVYDTGPSFRSGRDTGELVVLPYLYSRGVHSIDMLMLTHGDNDHVGGAQSVLAGLTTQRVLAGPSVHLPSHLELCSQGQQWRWDGVIFRVLHPTPADATEENNSSCVLRIEGSGGAVLLLGDIEHEIEARLNTNHLVERADVVVVPHHGSNTSSTQFLTQASAPQFALISAGYGNRWGFPKQQVVDRWHEVGAQTLKTANSGAIEITIDSTGLKPPREYRLTHGAYWRQ
jgi:competence protein ComEC